MDLIERPPLKYNGGKWRLAGWIQQYIPDHTTYVEPCFGGGGVFWNKKPSKFEVINDSDSLVIDFYEVLRDFPKELIRKIEFTPYSEQSLSKAFENLVNGTVSKIDRAYSFYVACWLSIRANDIRKSSINFRTKGNLTDVGGHNPARLFSKIRHLYKVAKRLKSCTILNQDIRTIIDLFDSPDTLFYIDLPYIGESRNTKRLYNNELTSEEQHIEILEKIRFAKGMFLVSHYFHPVYNNILSSYSRVVKDTLANSFSSRSNGAAKRTEVLYISPSAQERLHPQLFDFQSMKPFSLDEENEIMEGLTHGA
jgi:DNA adenine methylase